MTTVYHNPRCSKSRATLELLNEHSIRPDIVLYLENTPDKHTLQTIVSKLNCSVRDVIRKGEPVYKAFCLGDPKKSDDDLFEAILANPILLERPIVVRGDRAIIGRPSENILDLI